LGEVLEVVEVVDQEPVQLVVGHCEVEPESLELQLALELGLAVRGLLSLEQTPDVLAFLYCEGKTLHAEEFRTSEVRVSYASELLILPDYRNPFLKSLKMRLVLLLIFLNGANVPLPVLAIGKVLLPSVYHKDILSANALLEVEKLTEKLFDYDESETESIAA
jgi:hypothetical protein